MTICPPWEDMGSVCDCRRLEAGGGGGQTNGHVCGPRTQGPDDDSPLCLSPSPIWSAWISYLDDGQDTKLSRESRFCEGSRMGGPGSPQKGGPPRGGDVQGVLKRLVYPGEGGSRVSSKRWSTQGREGPGGPKRVVHRYMEVQLTVQKVLTAV